MLPHHMLEDGTPVIVCENNRQRHGGLVLSVNAERLWIAPHTLGLNGSGVMLGIVQPIRWDDIASVIRVSSEEDLSKAIAELDYADAVDADRAELARARA